MKAAIIGAGLSGLCCAITLEAYGIEPVVLEKRNTVGDRFVNGETMFSIMNRPVKDSLSYLKDKYNINLRPTDEINKLIIHSKNEIGSIDGRLGYTNIRGRHEASYERQLERQLKSRICFNSAHEYEDLCREFDCVVLATGDAEYACHLGNYNTDLTCTIKGVTVEGDFISSVCHVWFNYDIIPKGYAWLIPFSDKEANLVIAYPDYPDNIKLDTDSIFRSFYTSACRSLDQDLWVTDKFQITRYMMGICNKPKIGNTYFTGNCFGALSPGLGFGQFASMLTGIFCAYDICRIGSYEELTRPLYENYSNSLALREYLESLSDADLDSIIKNLDNNLIDGLIDKICSSGTKIDILKHITPLMKLKTL